MVNGTEEIYSWSAKSIVYNVVTRVGLVANYSCTQDMNGLKMMVL